MRNRSRLSFVGFMLSTTANNCGDLEARTFRWATISY
ncbi:MAG: hypothetical protein ACI814_003861 [Mariniblastus sp.]